MNTIKLIFPFRAISKDNEKMFNRHGRPFLSKKYKDFDALVKQQARIQYRGEILECPLIVSIIYRFKNKKHCDLFNLPKGIMDAMQGVIFKNDNQIKVGNQSCIDESATEDIFEVYVGVI